MYLDDPLFLEDWLARTGRRTNRFRPEFGARTWSFGANNEAIAELKEHASVTDDDDALIRLHCEAALESLDGFNGQLGVVLQERTVMQRYSCLAHVMEAIGPIKDTPAPVLEYRTSYKSTDWITLDTADYKVENESWSWVFRLTESGRQNVNIYSRYADYQLEPTEALARVSYTAGMATDISGLPADLRVAIYTLARRSFDFRDDTMPTSMAGFSKGGFLPTGVASILARYTKHVTI